MEPVGAHHRAGPNGDPPNHVASLAYMDIARGQRGSTQSHGSTGPSSSSDTMWNFSVVVNYFGQILAYFVDYAEAHEKYHREEEPAVTDKKTNENSNGDGSSDSATASGDAEFTNVDNGDELYLDELKELEATFSKVAIQEPSTYA
ncbi:zinc finger CCCH domain-containing protein 21-like [Pyrus ussuriensis x Pyrus communis]|uniref:Zinc finger CCCH domain-containing protein 21-like n=1 Tax=Pyrus ussuriensis x Pyrus communis TaxID=2448454 RepID=A0A5N5FSV3_9ROSA|nr:zinc finger CCCH domain-containing protein 21-like [Pyrus ussuriensis x Pyrus communis]